jgi:uncharacterized protein DUF5995
MIARNIVEVISELDRLVAFFRERQSRFAFFAALYRAVTMRVAAGIERGDFEDGERMDRFDTAFANRYFAAVDTLLAGGRPPRSWRIAFGAEARPGTLILQHLVLGMNAHINFDLPIAAIEVAPGGSLPELERDYLLDVLDRLGGRTDEAFVNFSIVNAREEAWHEATRLVGEQGAQRARSILSLDRRVALLAERIILPGGHFGLAIDLISRTEAVDVDLITERLLAMA